MIVAKYKFDKSIYENLIPVFNGGYEGYTVSDEIDSENENYVIRTISHDTIKPTHIQFGQYSTDTTEREMCLIGVEFLDVSNATNLSQLFARCLNLTYILGIENWDTSNVIDMSGVFYNCQLLTSIDVSNFNTANVTSMYCMFSNCTNLTSIDVSNFNTSNVTDMRSMFNLCQSLTSLDVSNFNTSNVTNMSYMFNNCKQLTTIGDVSNWNTSKVNSMSVMFYNCKNLTSLDISNWDTSKVNSMSQMFHNCSKLVSIGDISSWNVNVKQAASMFNNTKITSANLSGWKTITNPSFMFMNCSNLRYVDISNIDFSNIPEDNTGSSSGIFKDCSQLTDVGLLHCNATTVQKVIDSATNNKIDVTIWVKDTKASDYTATDYVAIKDYKEDNRTLYLNSPLLEGDEIVNKEGKLYHYHKMGSVVLDGDEGWGEFKINDYNIFSAYLTSNHYNNGNGHLIRNGKIIADIIPTLDTTNGTQEYMHLRPSKSSGMYIEGSISNINPQSPAGINNWLRKNPTTVIYELTKPYYELISDDPLIVKSYAEGKLDTSSIITPTSIQSIPYEEELTYLYTSTQYCIQFNSTANCTVDITLGGTKVESKSVSVGLNKIYITTPGTLVDNKLIINARGNAIISDVVVVNSNAEFDYFDGLKSSFEDCLVTDVDNENYGKYKVGVKIVGKNKFNGYAIAKHWKANFDGKTFTSVSNDNKNWIYPLKMSSAVINYTCVTTGDGNTSSAAFGFCHYDGTSTWCSVKPSWIGTRMKININKPFYGIQLANYCGINWSISDIQLEEGSVATSYEPYKETNAIIYLNSPLLQGDRIEVKDGKLCHYHKMGKRILDGVNEGWTYYQQTANENHISFFTTQKDAKATYGYRASDKFPSRGHWNLDVEGIAGDSAGTPRHTISIARKKLSTQDINGFRQWLQANPTTVVYTLANPYYEDITPIQSSFVISTVSEGDMEIITDLPIKSNITYLTNITSAVLMEQQLDELDNGTESLTNIVEDEINE